MSIIDQDMKRRGYLLLEMMIALAIVVTSVAIIATIEASIARWHRYATHYLMATILAQKIVAYTQEGKPYEHHSADFTVQVEKASLSAAVPYTLHTITISFDTPPPGGRVVMVGGSLHG